MWVSQVGMLALLYYVVASQSLAIASLPGNVSAVWPPTGLAVVALLRGGRRLWPAVFLGALATNAAGGLPLLVASALALGNTGEALTAGWLLRRRAVDPQLTTTADTLAYVFRVCVLATLVSASCGVGSLVLTARLAEDDGVIVS
jgi:integral membrane sensor domain MASE1